MSWSQSYQPSTPHEKPYQTNQQYSIPPADNTVVKNQTKLNHVQYDQIKTPMPQLNQPRKAMIFLGPNQSKHLFPVYKDSQIGIAGQFQKKIHHSNHDDDRMTTTTQLGLAISQTCQDLFQIIKNDKSSSSESPFSTFTQSDQTRNLRLS